jgi:hypothetical protein
MTQDRFVRRLPELMDELGRGDDTYLDDVLRQTAAIGQRSVWALGGLRFQLGPLPVARPLRDGRRLLVLVGLIALLALVVGTALYAGIRQPDPRPLTLSNGWIAYSTMPGGVQVGGTDTLTGGDIYLIREGVLAPILIASRGDGAIRNVCPAFSPDGRLLAFGRSTGEDDRFVVVLRVEDDGGTTEVARVLVAGTAPAPCAMWSRDGARLAYVDGGALVVRGLDGSVRTPVNGDPTLADLVRSVESREQGLLSPRGDLVAEDENGGCGVIVTRLDGSDARLVKPNCPSSVVAWSPDGEWLVVTSDASAFSFDLKVIRIESGAEPIVLVSSVRVNGTRSFPGRGDVSWQPVYR